jgi:ParB-like chromosome segregation protein Spo0J
MWPLDRLVPYEKNARTHSPVQIQQIAASITEFGFTNPILVDGADGILAGHGRLAAAKDMGLALVPVIVLDHLSAAQRKAYILADNQLALNAGWDTELLQMEVAALNLEDFDLSLLGFDDDRIASLLDPDGIDREEGPPTGADDPGKEYQQKYAVAVECDDEAEQETVYEKLNGEGYACRLLTV